MAPIDVAPQPTTSPRPPQTPPSSPTSLPQEQGLTIKHVQQFLELLKNIQANQTAPAPIGANQPANIEDISADKKIPRARASKVEFKKVNEV